MQSKLKNLGVFKSLTGKPTGNRALRKPRRKWEENIRMGIKEIGINKRNCIHSIPGRDYWRGLVNAD